MSKIVYLFDETNGLYIGEYEAQESPLEPGEYILPTCSTEKKPLKNKAGSVVIFTDAWKYAADNRGIWFDENRLERIVEKFDDVVAETWTREPTPLTPQEQLIAAAEAVRQALQSAIDKKAQALGFSGGNALMLYAGFGNPFQGIAQTFASWEASVWVEAEAYKTRVIAGEVPMLTPDEAVAMMPASQA